MSSPLRCSRVLDAASPHLVQPVPPAQAGTQAPVATQAPPVQRKQQVQQADGARPSPNRPGNGAAPEHGEVAGFEGVHLDESYVLDISQFNGELRFELDLALSAEHPCYRPPPECGRYCYRPAVLTFAGPEYVQWVERSDLIYTDPDGHLTDRGNIDSLRYSGGVYEVWGEWGRIRVRGGHCRLVIGGSRHVD